jgi:hypothetical protein
MYFNPNLCKHMRCPWLAEVELQQSGLELVNPHMRELQVSYTSIGPEYMTCWMKVLTLVENNKIDPLPHMLMPACVRTGFVQFSVPNTCPNAMEQSVLDPPNIVASQEDQAP